jgi:hypothetical protein
MATDHVPRFSLARSRVYARTAPTSGVLQDWLAQAPGTLGLGDVKIIDQEQARPPSSS